MVSIQSRFGYNRSAADPRTETAFKPWQAATLPCLSGAILPKDWERGRRKRILKITNYKAIGGTTLVAVFDLELQSGMVIYGALLMQKGDAQWVGFPGIPYEQAGQKKYKPVMDIPNRESKNKFNTAAMSALRDAGHIA